MLYDRRHHVDVALQGSLLTSVIPPTDQIWDWFIAFLQTAGW